MFIHKIFAAKNSSWLDMADKKFNKLIGQVKSSCDIVLVGKTIWKSMTIPQLLYGRAAVPTTELDIKKTAKN